MDIWAVRYIKRTTGESIIPYLYIGPLLYLVPYGTFWTWENDVLPVRYIDERLEDLLNKFQSMFFTSYVSYPYLKSTPTLSYSSLILTPT